MRFWYKEHADAPLLDVLDAVCGGRTVYPDAAPPVALGNARAAELTEAELAVGANCRRWRRVVAVVGLCALVLSVAVMTNDLHQQAFTFVDEIPDENGAYSLGSVYWAIVSFIAVLLAASVVFLVKAARAARLGGRVKRRLRLLADDAPNPLPCIIANASPRGSEAPGARGVFWRWRDAYTKNSSKSGSVMQSLMCMNWVRPKASAAHARETVCLPRPHERSAYMRAGAVMSTWL